jgi:hypothetical protein
MNTLSSRAPRPYLSIVIALRDDDYPHPLADRVRMFASRVAGQLGDGADGLYELVVVDWNPPPGARASAAAFDFGGVRALRHIVVPPHVHDMIAGSSTVPAFRDRPMLDYYARNVGIRYSTGRFVLVANQDILMSDVVAATIRARALRADCFYRADRADVDVDPSVPLPHDLMAHAVVVHRRHSLRYDAISVESAEGSVLHGDEQVDGAAFVGRTFDEYWASAPRAGGDGTSRRPATFHSVAPAVGLHTNGGGDFVIAHREAWEVVRAFPETDAFYWHLDAYAVCHLWAAGYRQALFAAPGCVFHVEHARGSRGSGEAITWAEHDVVLGRVLDGRDPPWFNAPSWGLPGLAGVG